MSLSTIVSKLPPGPEFSRVMASVVRPAAVIGMHEHSVEESKDARPKLATPSLPVVTRLALIAACAPVIDAPVAQSVTTTSRPPTVWPAKSVGPTL